MVRVIKSQWNLVKFDTFLGFTRPIANRTTPELKPAESFRVRAIESRVIFHIYGYLLRETTYTEGHRFHAPNLLIIPM